MIIIRSIGCYGGWHDSVKSKPMPAAPQNLNFKNSFGILSEKNGDFLTLLRETSHGTIEHMNGTHSDVRVATVYGQHGVFDTEANINDLEKDDYYVVWSWKVFFEF